MALVLSWRVAVAKPKVAVVPFEGDTSGEVRDAVAAALDGNELSVISSKEVKSAVDKLGNPKELAEKDLRRLATELSADAVFAARLDKAGATRTLKVRLFINQQMAKGFTVSFKDARSEKFRTMLRDKMIDKVKEAAPEPAAPPPADVTISEPPASPPPSPDLSLKPDAPMADAPVPTARTQPPADAAPDTGVATAAPGVRSVNLAAVRLEVGASFAQRSFTFDTQEFAGKPTDTTLDGVPGIRVEVEGYPLAILRPGSRLAGLGLAADYDKTLLLNVNEGAMPGVDAPVNQSAFSVGLRYRHAFGDTPRSATLTAGVGYGKRTFSPDRAKFSGQALSDSQRDTPEIDYAIIDPGVAFRMPITRMIAVSVAGRALVVTGAGAIQDGTTSYGGASVFGAEATAGADILLGKRFVVRVAAEFVQIGFSFNGGGQLSNNLDSNAATQEVNGLTDRSLGGTATFGVVY